MVFIFAQIVTLGIATLGVLHNREELKRSCNVNSKI